MNWESIAANVRQHLPLAPLTHVEGLPYPRVGRGKVRDLFDTGEHLLIIASDRLSAFDVVLPDGIPGKGIILTQISLFWFAETEALIPNHLVPDHAQALAQVLKGHEDLIPRSMLVRKLKPLPVEAVARGYLSGSAWKSYVRTGTVFGQPLPAGLLESDKLPIPLFTPTTKAQQGHDEPLSPEQAEALLGEMYEPVRDLTLQLYGLGVVAARRANLLLADTKFEFGTDAEGTLHLIDEVLTPDSSRYWPADLYQPGKAQPAYDKQFVRDYLDGLSWDKLPPGPRLPESVIEGTRQRYLAALEKLFLGGK